MASKGLLRYLIGNWGLNQHQMVLSIYHGVVDKIYTAELSSQPAHCLAITEHFSYTQALETVPVFS